MRSVVRERIAAARGRGVGAHRSMIQVRCSLRVCVCVCVCVCLYSSIINLYRTNANDPRRGHEEAGSGAFRREIG